MTQYWTFAANPRYWRVEEAIAETSSGYWNTNHSDLHAGDRVAIWKYKGNDQERGVIAFALVETDPEDRDVSEDRYWTEEGLRNQPSSQPRVRLRYFSAPGLPIWAGRGDSVVNELRVARAQGGTVNKVTDEQFARLLDEVGGWPGPASPVRRLTDLTDPEAVTRAVAEYNALGKEAFLQKYGFGPARTYFLHFDGSDYDSKAIAGAAFGIQHPALGPLMANEFSGGEATVARVLRQMGFQIQRTAKRNPPWERDELILALDLYLRHRPHLLDDTHDEVVELSNVLNALPIHTDRPDEETFRNPNGVAMKLGNFAALDPEYPGAGLRAGGRGDVKVWKAYHNRPSELASLAQELRDLASTGTAPANEEEYEDEAEEGRIIYRTHRRYERDAKLRARKIESVQGSSGRLACEVCDFDFSLTYGEELGHGFIEVHHRVPLSELGGRRRTTLSDLALVCCNCHRMLHRARPWLTPKELQDVLQVAANR